MCGNSGELEEHHVVPRSYGGSSGPTVTICTECHTVTHKTALRKDGQPPSISKRWTAESIPKIQYLADVIRKSRLLVNKDVNKTVQLNLKLTGALATKLKEVQHALGLKNQDQAIEAAIDSIHLKILGI